MHELALAEGVLKVALRTLNGQAERKVTLIKLRIGKMTHVDSAALQFAFDAVAQGTEAQEAKLLLERIPIKLRCLKCGQETLTEQYRLECAGCGSFSTEIIAGRELAVEYVEVE